MGWFVGRWGVGRPAGRSVRPPTCRSVGLQSGRSVVWSVGRLLRQLPHSKVKPPRPLATHISKEFPPPPLLKIHCLPNFWSLPPCSFSFARPPGNLNLRFWPGTRPRKSADLFERRASGTKQASNEQRATSNEQRATSNEQPTQQTSSMQQAAAATHDE